MQFDPHFRVTAHGEHEIHIEREFAAPRELVYRAMSEPELLARWMTGPPGWSMVECTNDVRVGGAFRHVWHGEGGAAMSMGGVYREVEAPARLVRTERFDFGCEAQAAEQVATLELFEAGGRTRVRISVAFPSREARDAALASGMEQGIGAGYARLDGLLAEPARR